VALTALGSDGAGALSWIGPGPRRHHFLLVGPGLMFAIFMPYRGPYYLSLTVAPEPLEGRGTPSEACRDPVSLSFNSMRVRASAPTGCSPRASGGVGHSPEAYLWTLDRAHWECRAPWGGRCCGGESCPFSGWAEDEAPLLKPPVVGARDDGGSTLCHDRCNGSRLTRGGSRGGACRHHFASVVLPMSPYKYRITEYDVAHRHFCLR
jgi:hypothetical protein